MQRPPTIFVKPLEHPLDSGAVKRPTFTILTQYTPLYYIARHAISIRTFIHRHDVTATVFRLSPKISSSFTSRSSSGSRPDPGREFMKSDRFVVRIGRTRSRSGEIRILQCLRIRNFGFRRSSRFRDIFSNPYFGFLKLRFYAVSSIAQILSHITRP